MLKARTKLTPTSVRTREQLMLTGERLFAEQGLDNVSLRQINAEAGQRNSSASHYHFGSKESLIAAISEFRFTHLNERRMALLAAQPPGDGPLPVRTLVEILVRPIADEIDETDGGDYFIRFMSQVIGHPATSLTAMWRSQFDGSVREVYQGLRQALAEIPDEVFASRFGVMWMLTVNALADRQRLSEVAGSADSYFLPALFISNLVDSLAGFMAAPVSEGTLAEVRALGNRNARDT